MALAAEGGATSLPSEPRELVYRAVKSILIDGSFKVPSALAAAARGTASSLLLYCGDSPTSPELFSTFSKKLVTDLKSCFVPQRSHKLAKETMWGYYHVLRSSAQFRGAWVKFVQEAIGRTASPVFYQHVTHEVFKQLIKLKYSVSDSTNTDTNSQHLTREEENTLRYVAGYVCRKLKVQLESSSHPSKEVMIVCLMDMSGDESDEERGTEDWTNLIVRGGLWHISDQAYALFYAMEEEVRSHLTPAAASKLHEGSRQSLVDAVMRNEEVSFQWCMLAADTDDTDDTEANELLHMIVQLYVTIRGFSFANSCVELFKKSSKKALQKGKGIRKELFTSNVRT